MPSEGLRVIPPGQRSAQSFELEKLTGLALYYTFGVALCPNLICAAALKRCW